MHKVIQLLTLIIFIHLCFWISAQEDIKIDLAKRNQIKIAEAYVKDSLGSNDSFLITKEYFNKMGRTTLMEIYGRDGLRCSYSYFYKDDTIRIERITVCYGKFISKTKIWYDRKNREIKAIDYDENGKKTGIFSKVKYNDKRRTKVVTIHFGNGSTKELKYQYDKNMNIVASFEKKNGVWIDKSSSIDKGISNYEEKNYKGTHLTRTSTTIENKEAKTLIALKGKLKLEIGDKLKTETYRMDNGLISYQYQYLNDQFDGMKRYIYYTY